MAAKRVLIRRRGGAAVRGFWRGVRRNGHAPRNQRGRIVVHDDFTGMKRAVDVARGVRRIEIVRRSRAAAGSNRRSPPVR